MDNQAHKYDWIRQEYEALKSRHNREIAWAVDWWGISLCAITKALGMEESRFAHVFIREELPKKMKAHIYKIIKGILTQDGHFDDGCQDDFEAQLRECVKAFEVERQREFHAKMQLLQENFLYSTSANVSLESLLDTRRRAGK